MRWLSSLVALLLCASSLPAADWPQWLGPHRDGSTSETVSAWKEAPRVVWHVPVGEGHSSPIVAGRRLYLHDKVNNEDAERVTAFDLDKGNVIWRKTYPRGRFGSVFGNGPRATPAFADGSLFTFGVTGIMTCYDAKTGTQRWQVDTLKRFKANNLFFGASCSPLIEGKMVFINVGGPDASVVAFATDTGDVKWKALNGAASYSSPIALGKGDKLQLIFFTKRGLASLKPADGSVFWRFPLVDLLSESSTTPVAIGDMLFASSITYGGVGLRLGEQGSKPNAKEAWKNPDLTCYFSTPVAVGENLFMVKGTKPPAISVHADLVCVDPATGKQRWQKPRVGKYHASLLRTGNQKLLMLDDAGNLILLEPNPIEYRELCRAKVCGESWSHPALADGRLYLRDTKELICVQLKP